MQLKKSPSSFSNFSIKNLANSDQIQKAIQKQLKHLPEDLCSIACNSGKNNIYTRIQNLSSNKRQRRVLKIQIIKEEEQKKLKSKFSNKQALNYFPVYTTLMDSQFLKNPQRPEMVGCLQSYRSKNNEQKMLVQRRKLAPIKKNKNQKFSSRNIHVSFLSVQKAPFLNQQLKSFDVNTMTMTSSMFNKNKFSITKKSFLSYKTLEGSINPERGYFSKEQMVRAARNKPFTPPFQRYSYFDFLWKVGYSNNIRSQFPQVLQKKYKAYVGPGNNSNLIITLLKRRDSWWTLTDKIEEANFAWTQIKINSVFNSQNSNDAALSIQLEQQQQMIAHKTPIYRRNIKIMNEKQTKTWIKYFHENRQVEQKISQSFKQRNRILKNSRMLAIECDKIKIHNHFPQNYVLGNKKALFSTMKKYYECSNKDVFQYLPLTFHIEKGMEDPEYYSFLKHYYAKSKQNKTNRSKNIWIVKPGQFTNRGNGIIVCHKLDDIKSILKNRYRLENGAYRTYIVQQYLQRPFLYFGRKFDIRHYMLITSVNGHMKGYWCQLGYIRTTSYQYSVNNAFSSVHLTNDAVQKLLPDYGKYQKGNKISYEQFQNYLQNQCSGKFSFKNTIYPKMKAIAHDSMRASSSLLDPDRKGHNFQIFGFDFMIDSKFHPWLIQINTNPCLQLNCPVLMEVIPAMVQNALKIGLDSILVPPQGFEEKRARFSNNVLEDNNFQLLYDSTVQQNSINELMKGQKAVLNFKDLEKDQEQVYEDDGILLQD